MKDFSLRALLAAVALALPACSGGAGSTSPSRLTPTTDVQPGATQETRARSSEMLAGDAGAPVTAIYVANFSAFGDISSFDTQGHMIAQSASNLDGPQNVAISNAGRVFVANLGDNIVSFSRGLTNEKTVASLGDGGVGLALGLQGKIFVTLESSGDVVAYNIMSGQQVQPTIPGPGACCTYVAVNRLGKIYVTSGTENILRSYKPDGTPTTPTITAGLNGPGPVVVDGNGKIYVANSPASGTGSITTYLPDGTQTTPTIAVNAPHGLTVASNGNIYVTDSMDGIVRSFNANGAPIRPIIRGFTSPTGVAVLGSN